MDQQLLSETLYLIYRLLREVPLERVDLSDTVQTLERELNGSCVLGERVLWNGARLPSTLKDLDRKHSHISSGLLGQHLQELLRLKHAHDFTPRSLLAIEDVSKENDCSREEFLQQSKKLVDCITAIAARNADSQRLRSRLLTLESSSPDSAVEEGYSADLKQIGLAREKGDILRKLESNQVVSAVLESDLRDSESRLRQRGRLGADIYRGSVQNSLSWLQNRQAGNICSRYSTNGDTRLSPFVSSQAAEVWLRMSSAYKLQYITSGHFLTPAYCAIFDRSGRYALTGADDTLVKVWDADRGSLVMTLRGHKGYITFIAVSPDNALVASSCTEGEIRLWRLRDGECVALLKHSRAVNWMKFDELTGALASGGDDGFAYIW